jgi:uncharacterized protein DUF6496
MFGQSANGVRCMPYDEVMHKFKEGSLKSGSGGKVQSRKQAIAIMLSEKRGAEHGKSEYKPLADAMAKRYKK